MNPQGHFFTFLIGEVLNCPLDGGVTFDASAVFGTQPDGVLQVHWYTVVRKAGVAAANLAPAVMLGEGPLDAARFVQQLASAAIAPVSERPAVPVLTWDPSGKFTIFPKPDVAGDDFDVQACVEWVGTKR